MRLVEKPKLGLRQRIDRWWNGPRQRAARVQPERQRVAYGPLGPTVVNYSPTGLGYGSRQSLRESNLPAAQQASGDAHLRYDLDDLVAESQRLARDNTIYRALLKRLVDLVVGSGLKRQARTDNERTNKDVEFVWDKFARRPEIRGMDDWESFLRKLVWHVLVDGRVLIIKDEASRKAQVVSGDLIWSLTPVARNENRIESGVEIDLQGRPLRFHIARWDESGLNRVDTGETVEAANAIYWCCRDRIDDTAGAPPLQAIFSHLHRLNTVFDNEAAAWELLSRFAVKIIRKNAGTLGFNSTNAPESSDSRTKASDRVHEFGWGLAFWGEEGEDIGGIERNIPSPNFDQSVKAFMRICGMEIGLSLPFFLLDWSEVNYSSGRAGAQQFWRNAQFFLSGLIYAADELYDWVVSRAAERNELTDRPDITRHEFIADPFQPLDADKEYMANQTAMNSGQKTLTRTLKEQGRERLEHFDERTSELADAARRVAAHNKEFPDAPITLSQYIGEQPSDAAPAAEGESQPEPTETELIKQEIDAYGVAVRAGAVTPQQDDEDHFRAKLGLPTKSAEAGKAWEKDEGTRRPITLTPPPGQEAPPIGGVPTADEPAEPVEASA